MLLSLLFQNPIVFILVFAGLVLALTIHEFAHALAADKLGDPTPRLQDRLTLNPLAHLDPIGTLLLLVAGFGWGKPVMFDPYNLDNPKRDAALISLAGPASNIILAIILSLIIRTNPFTGPAALLLDAILRPSIYLNIVLAIFNLIPIHPLDGGKILIGLLPHDMAVEAEDFLRRYGTIILIMLILPINNGVSPVSSLISPVISTIISILLPN